jgi:DNA primase
LVELARPLLSKLQPGALQQMMFDKLGQLTQLDPHRVGLGSKSRAEAPRPERHFNKTISAPKEPPTLMRRAVALLLQYPALGSQIAADADLSLVRALPGAEVFEEVLRLTQQHPNFSTGAILEWFRGSEHETVVEKLAFLPDPAIDRDVSSEFNDLWMKLMEEARRLRVDGLRHKQDPSAEEKAELARLLAEKVRSGDLPR